MRKEVKKGLVEASEDIGLNQMVQTREMHCAGCLPPSTMVAGEKYQTISGFSPSDNLYGISKDNQVTKKFQHAYKGNLVVIKPRGFLPLSLTPNHELLVVTGRRSRPKKKRTINFTKPEWIKASLIKSQPNPYAGKSEGHYLIIPRVKGIIRKASINLSPFAKDGIANRRLIRRLPLIPEIAWLLGLYTADGASSNAAVWFYLTPGKEQDLSNHIQDIAKREFGLHPSQKMGKTCLEVCLSSRILARAFKEWCGGHANEKHIPDFILRHTHKELCVAFLQGYLSGDGYLNKSTYNEGSCYQAKTVSLQLALQLQLLGARLGQIFNISSRDNSKYPSHLDNRIIKGNGTSYDICIHAGPVMEALGVFNKPRRPGYKVRRSYILIPITKVEKMLYHGNVHNLESKDGIYLAQNVVVHNCGRFLGFEAILWGLVKLKCPNSKCKQWNTVDISPKNEEQG